MRTAFNQLQRLLEDKIYDRIKNQPDNYVSDVDAVEMINEKLDDLADLLVDALFEEDEDSDEDGEDGEIEE